MTTSIPFLDLGRIHRPLEEVFIRVLRKVVQSNGFALGPMVAEFEQDFSSYCEAKHCVAVSSGTDALVLALRALGVGRRHEVITVPNTFIATAEAISLVGAKPVFVDVDPATLLIDVEEIEAAITDHTRAIIPVDLFGCPADIDAIRKIADRHALFVIEDACQAHGARYKGRRVGGLSAHATCFSFYPIKNLGALGEGGAITTDDDILAEHLRSLRDHGQAEKHVHQEVSQNARMHGIQGGFLSAKLQHLDDWNGERRQIAAQYDRALSELNIIVSPTTVEWAEPVFHLYVIRTKWRDACRAFLAERQIATGIHYPTPIHLQPAYTHLEFLAGSFPEAEKAASEILSLPIFPGMTGREVDCVCEALRSLADTAS